MKEQNIIGPFSPKDWKLMRDIRESNEYLTSYGSLFQSVIDKQKKNYKEYIRKYL